MESKYFQIFCHCCPVKILLIIVTIYFIIRYKINYIFRLENCFDPICGMLQKVIPQEVHKCIVAKQSFLNSWSFFPGTSLHVRYTGIKATIGFGPSVVVTSCYA
jgi:hypothetical protein